MNRECSPIDVCDSWSEWESLAPTYNSNRVCLPLSVCGPHEWIKVEKTATSDRQCQPLTVCNASTQYEADPPGNWTRITPTPNMVHFVEYDTFADSFASRYIKLSVDLSSCTVPQTRVYEIEVISNGTNAALNASTKADTEFQSITGACGTADNSTCTSARAVDGISDDEFSRWISDNVTSYIIIDLGAVMDVDEIRIFAGYNGQTAGLCQHNLSRWSGSNSGDLDSIDAEATEWSTLVAHSLMATADRDCTALTVCDAGDYEAVAPTEVSDRECLPITECTTVSVAGDAATQYIAAEATAFSDTSCKALTVCAGSTEEATKATDTSDRTCATLQAATAGGSGSDSTASATTFAIVGMCAFLALVALIAVRQHKKNQKPPQYVVPEAEKGLNPMYSGAGSMGGNSQYETVYDEMKIREGVRGSNGYAAPYSHVRGASGDATYGSASGGERRPSAALESGYALGAADEEATYGRAGGMPAGAQAVYARGSAQPGNEYALGAAGNTYDVGGAGQVYAGASALENDSVTFANTGHDYAIGQANPAYDYHAIGGNAQYEDDTYDNHAGATAEPEYGVATRTNSYGKALDVDLDAGYNTLNRQENIYGI